MPKVSVIVPIYKVEKYLVQCLDSIVNQTLKDIEIILVDEGDFDACRFIIDHYEQTDSRVIAIHEKNGGYGASVNKGFDRATGEYISIIESDDFIAPTMFEEMYNYAKKLDADVVKIPYYEYYDKTANSKERAVLSSVSNEKYQIPENCTFPIEKYPMLLAIHPSIWAALYKTQYLKEKNIRCIEEKGAGYVDNHFRIQTLCQTDKIAWLNKAFNYYRLTNEDASTVHYNINVFIKRWNDVHKLFNEKFPQKWNSLAPYCLKEEFTNTYNKLRKKHYKISKESYEMLRENLSYLLYSDIKKIPQISLGARLYLLKIKIFPHLLKLYVNKHGVK